MYGFRGVAAQWNLYLPIQENKSENQKYEAKNHTNMESPSPQNKEGKPKGAWYKMWNLQTLLNTENLIVLSNKSFNKY